MTSLPPPPRALQCQQAGWPLGADCCLILLQEESLPVSEPLQAASLVRSPGFLAGARCRWAATLAAGMEASPPHGPWMDALAGPGGGPLPRRLYTLLFGEAQADVVNLNCFLIRLLPLPAWAVFHQPGTLAASLRPTAHSPRIPAKDSTSWSGRGWGGAGWAPGLHDSPPAPWGCWTHWEGLSDAALLWFPVTVGAGWEESRDQPTQASRTPAGAGRSLGSPSVLLGMPLF